MTPQEQALRRSLDPNLVRYLNLKLCALGEPISKATADPEFMATAGPLLRNHRQKAQILGWPLCPADLRIQAYLERTLRGLRPELEVRLPGRTLGLDQPGLARTLSLPATRDEFSSPYLTSYRTAQGVLHNPAADRRTTQGVFHVAAGGLPVPADKIEAPLRTFAHLLAKALQPPADVLTLPFTADQAEVARVFVSLLLRPVVCPATDREPVKTMEVRFFAPGTLVSNLDFVEAIFGNAGDPFLPENDAALDVEHWTGHTGCVVLAPHLVGVRARDVGLPHYDQATDRQRRDGMFWRHEDDRYNGGRAFKVTCRDASGVIVTVIADNYYGYCKKEVKTQISFAANLFGASEEEHAGGAVAYASYVLGNDFYASNSYRLSEATIEDAVRLLGDRVEVTPDGHAVDRANRDIVYVPENAEFHARECGVAWTHQGARRSLTLKKGVEYVLPTGYRVRLEKQPGGTAWRLIGTRPDGVLCHKPCTVSGGGKSEISKSLTPMLQRGPIFVKDHEHDLEQVKEITRRDFSTIYRTPRSDARARRPLLSPERSLGSVIKLLTPSADYSDEYNAWVRELPQTLRQLVFVLKRHYRPEWGDDWARHFTVDRINGYPGHELKFANQRLVGNYLRVGFDPENGAWRVYKLRPDFSPAEKVQVEDDITATTVVPRERVSGPAGGFTHPSVKLVHNCESHLFQRPDDAIHRGFDQQAEADLAAPGAFVSNFQPLTREEARALVDHVTEFDLYTDPMKRLLEGFVASGPVDYVVSSAHPRIVDGKPTKNPRYLQKRPDVVNARATYLAEVGERLYRRIPADLPVLKPVDAVLAGRRNNPPQPEIGLPPLAVYNPIHYQELPELFMDFISSLTGKSPSTTGFGSEGALTKAPFNALWPVVDLNNALLAYILTGYDGFTTAAGHIGPRYRVDHDLSMLVPEVWCRMRREERDARYLVAHGYFEKVADFTLDGRTVLASRLGYRMTEKFVEHFLGRLFETPSTVFTEEMLRPELQGREVFASGVDSIVEAQTRVAMGYFDDGSVEAACPPLRALLHVMAYGHYEGLRLEDAEFRRLFDREETLSSAWYQERLQTKQRRDVALWERHLRRVEADPGADLAARAVLRPAKAIARERLAQVRAPTYLEELRGTLGADPFHGQLAEQERGDVASSWTPEGAPERPPEGRVPADSPAPS